jgi:integrase/recombinase XerD
MTAEETHIRVNGTRTAVAGRPRELGGRTEDVAAAWLTRHSEGTRAAYMADLRDFSEFCSSVDVADPLEADPAHLDAYQADMRERQLSAATIARRLSALSGLYEYAASEAVIDESPVAGVKRPKLRKKPATLGLDRDQLAAFLEAAAAAGPRDHALASILVLNGLRVSEICQADVSDLLDIDGHRALAVTRASGTRALAPLATTTTGAIDAYLAGRSTGPLLLDNSGRGRLDRHDAARIVRRLGKAARIGRRISPDTLRHSFVRAALETGAPLQHVQEAAGHADPRTTQRYEPAEQSLGQHPTFAVAAALQNGSKLKRSA